MFYLMTHSTHFIIYSYVAWNIWLRTTEVIRNKTCCCHFTDYAFQLAARALLYVLYHRQESTYHGLCYTSCGALAGTRNSLIGSPSGIDLTTSCTTRECSTTELHSAPFTWWYVVELWPCLKHPFNSALCIDMLYDCTYGFVTSIIPQTG